MAIVVRFVGGALDGQHVSMDEVRLVYRHEAYSRSEDRRTRGTEYTLVRNSSGTPFYVENELLELAKAQGINPLPLD